MEDIIGKNLPTVSAEVTEHPTLPADDNQAAPEVEEENSFVSFHSNVSTPFDTILLAHAQNLRSEVDNIKLNICSILKTDIDKFASVTANSIKANSSLNKLTLAESLINLLTQSEKVCAVVGGRKLVPPRSHNGSANLSRTGSRDNIEPPPSSTLLGIQNRIDELANTHVAGNKDILMSIQNQLNELQTSIDQLESTKRSVSTPDGIAPPMTTPGLLGPTFSTFQLRAPPPPAMPLQEIQNKLDPTAKHISAYKENFVKPDLSKQLTEVLKQHDEKFAMNSETGHGVISFGEVYEYNGAKAVKPISKNFPAPIQSLVNNIKKEFPEAVINQCLINKYTGATSFLPEHSDDESTIVHDSDIFTLSLGGTADIMFKKKDNSALEEILTVKGNSLYVMSKKSQRLWTLMIASLFYMRMILTYSSQAHPKNPHT